MATGQQVITDNDSMKRYRTELPNMVDDEMDPFQMRLYVHYKRVCGASGGECWEAVRTTATKCKMSAEKVIGTRQWLIDNGWILADQDDKNIYHITITDRWPENFVRYSEQSVRNSERGVRNSERGALDISNQRKNSIKKEPIKKEPVRSVADATPPQPTSNEDDSFSSPVKATAAPPVASPPPTTSVPRNLSEQQEWFGVVCAIVGWDYQTLGAREKAQVAQTLGIIRKAGYSLDELKQFLPKVWHQDWRWTKNGSYPTLTQLKTEIGKVRRSTFVPASIPQAGSQYDVYAQYTNTIS